MGREIKRVPLAFDWPIGERWTGYLSPQKFRETPCPVCEASGYSPEGRRLHDLWYGNIWFDPAEHGGTPYDANTPEVRAFAQRNVDHAPEFYGSSEAAVVNEARRLASLFNSQWQHHLTQQDVDVLVAADYLRDFTHTWDKEHGWQRIEPTPQVTAERVNRWSITSPLGLGSSACYLLIEDRCKRLGVPDVCPACDGHGSTEAYEGQRAEADAWECTEPPTGDGWQLWETVSEGSPISPVFATPEKLARWMVSGQSKWMMPDDYDVALRFIKAGWAPTAAAQDGILLDGVTFIGREN